MTIPLDASSSIVVDAFQFNLLMAIFAVLCAVVSQAWEWITTRDMVSDDRGQAANDAIMVGWPIAIGVVAIVFSSVGELPDPAAPTVQLSPWATAVVSIVLMIPPCVAIGYAWGRASGGEET